MVFWFPKGVEMNKQIRLLFTTVLVFSLGFSFAPFQSFQQQNEGNSNLDVLFLIDRSGSMSGDDSLKPSDPLGLRFFGPLYAMEWLGSDRLLVHNESAYRIGVVHFGSDAQVGMDWETIVPETQEEWKIVREDLRERLSPADLQGKSLGNTNFLEAFEYAKQFFQSNKQSGLANADKKVIVILTDGAPYVSDEGENFSIDGHMNQVREFVSKNFSVDEGYSIYVASIQNSSNNSTWALMKKYWDGITNGNAVQVTSDDDIGSFFQNILIEQTSNFKNVSSFSDEKIQPGRISVDPFLQSLSFTIFKSSLDQEYGILLPDGTDLVGSNLSYEILGAGEPIEVINITNPPSGFWTLSVQGKEDIQIRMRQVTGNGTLIIPQGDLTENLPVIIDFSLLGQDGLSIPDYGAPLIIQGKITREETSEALSFSQFGDNVYRATYYPLEPGLYTLKFDATTVDNAGDTLILFSQEASFNVKPLSTNVEDQITSANIFQPLKFRISVHDAYGRIISEIPNDMYFELVAPDSKNEIAVNFIDEMFVINFTPTNTGEYAINLVDRNGSKNVQEFVVFDPIVEISDFPGEVYAYDEVKVFVEIQGVKNATPNWLDSGSFSLYVDASVDGEPVTSQKMSTGSYAITYRPEEVGIEEMEISVGVKYDNDAKYILQEEVYKFDIIESSPIEVKTKSIYREAWRSFGLKVPFLERKPWEIELDIVDLEGRKVDFQDVTKVELNQLFDVSVYKNDVKIPQGNISILSQGDGRIKIIGDILEKGNYVVRVKPNSLLLPGYVWVDNLIEVRMSVVENLIVTLAQTLFYLSIFLILFYSYRRVLTLFLSRNPCEGYLLASDLDKRIVWQLNMGEKKSSLIVVKSNEVGLLPAKSLQIWNVRSQSGELAKIRVRYKLNSGVNKTVELVIGDTLKIETVDCLLSYIGNLSEQKMKEGE